MSAYEYACVYCDGDYDVSYDLNRIEREERERKEREEFLKEREEMYNFFKSL